MDYATQSRFSDPGRHRDWLDATPADLERLRDIASGLVFHHWGNGDPAGHGFGPERLAEIDLRYAEAILGRLRELNPVLDAQRSATERVLGCCRDFTLLYVTLLRHHGIPARTRVGFGGYLMPGWHIDHVVAEVWDGERWRLVEPGFPRDNELDVDLMDVPRDRFLVGADAWRALRSGALDPARFAVSPDLTEPFLRGLPYARHNLALDIAALNKHEMVLWDIWGSMNLDATVSEADALRADELAAVDPDDAAALARAFAADDLRVPSVIRSISPITHVLAEVSLTPA
ncbi:transglutaminase-like domain-containing protein [Kutzneria sp. CA-103260]|uniref:transglutaminase-like domain-containing protein n=1 Tax=Kutzneria sp. CA-103260 TaxID=2802641 RepID=UPI001BAB3406|nr:transglutaminase-like domain-containing protein [Kutzneria sp. CA-103260]QUQ67280.1 Transglutaminase-like superfamily protein [Kutzneria sp. CA-103260]